MKCDDPNADNLFARLMSYTPREGRTATEDFCTEVLAWCIRFREFRKIFFKMLENTRPRVELMRYTKCEAKIDTQLSFKELEEDAERRRRFDLVIRSTNESRFAIVIETKLDWRFTEGQIPAYARELENGERFSKPNCQAKTKILVVLSPTGQRPEYSSETIPIVAISWSQVQEALSEFSQPLVIKSLNNNSFAFERSVASQFASFLKQKGYFDMKLPKTNTSDLPSWAAAVELYDSLKRVLTDVREDKNVKNFLKREPTFTRDESPRCAWLGFYNSTETYLYIGFGMPKSKDNSGVLMRVEADNEKLDKVKRSKLVRCGWKDLKDVIVVDKSISTPAARF